MVLKEETFGASNLTRRRNINDQSSQNLQNFGSETKTRSGHSRGRLDIGYSKDGNFRSTRIEWVNFSLLPFALLIYVVRAGKSTILSILGGLTGLTSGTVVFEGGTLRPPPGTIGIVPQKNVLFPELTCYQTLRVWRAIKWSESSQTSEDLVQLLRDCDLGSKVHLNAGTLSGGQKRKLQLAIGLVGGSKIVLVDECTSGVDPLSRRALWRTLTGFRQERTIIFTTHASLPLSNNALGIETVF